MLLGKAENIILFVCPPLTYPLFTPYPKNYIAILWGKIFLLFDNLVGIQVYRTFFSANARCLPIIISIVESIIVAMNAKDQLIIQSRSMLDCVARFIR